MPRRAAARFTVAVYAIFFDAATPYADCCCSLMIRYAATPHLMPRCRCLIIDAAYAADAAGMPISPPLFRAPLLRRLAIFADITPFSAPRCACHYADATHMFR